MKATRKANLTEGPIIPQLTRLTIPMIFGIFSMVALNLVDAYFLGKLGSDELAALGFTIPVVLVLGAIGMGVSMGASAVVSRAVGEKDRRKVQRLTMDSLFLAVIFAGTFVLIGLLSIEPLFQLLGAGPDILPLVREYMQVWYLGVIFVIVPFVGNSAIRADGDTLTPSIIMMSMVVVNIVLDPLFIFGWGAFPAMGVQGAAIATVIARAVSLVVGLAVLYRRDMLTRHLPDWPTLMASWKRVLHIGLPAAATNLVVPLTTGLITSLVARFGPEAVAALGVASRIDLFAIMTVVALSSVMGPFTGQNIGARNLDRLATGINLSQRFSFLWGLLMLGLIILLRRPIAGLFSEDPKVIEALVLYLSIAPIGYAFRCLYALDNTLLNVMERPFTASGITIAQMFGLYLPGAYLGAQYFGLAGVFAAIPLTFLGGGLVSLWFVQRQMKQLKQQEEQQRSEEQVPEVA